MNGTKLLTAAMAALVLVGGLTAVGAATPADVSNANSGEAEATNASEADDDTAETTNASENADTADDRAGTVGPADGLPERMPDHVSEIHDTIESFLDGSIDSLGESVSDLRSDDSGEETSDDENGGDGDAAAHSS
ncbi:hypothetical protein [Natrinema salinisoli]|uniref:hypothetical protein n=1 Tax=Natrinema salinisoli TaxID=2878535 RepID=UPI001CEFBB67|nr:hypothetical protein [Natrinema salinisoli]